MSCVATWEARAVRRDQRVRIRLRLMGPQSLTHPPPRRTYKGVSGFQPYHPPASGTTTSAAAHPLGANGHRHTVCVTVVPRAHGSVSLRPAGLRILSAWIRIGSYGRSLPGNLHASIACPPPHPPRHICFTPTPCERRTHPAHLRALAHPHPIPVRPTPASSKLTV